jgi:histidine ammonia-lyase
VSRILAVELTTAARAAHLRAPLQCGPATDAVCGVLRERIAPPGPDRFVAPDLAAAEEMVSSGAILDAAESALGGRLR